MAERKPLSKRLRFEIFKRDGFRCIYCGASPLQRPLHVDHVEAVANGGTDDPANLVTACDACNLGKAAVRLGDKVLSVGPVDEAQQEQPDQIRAYLEAQRELAKAKSAVVEAFEQYWMERVGLEPDPFLLPRLPSLVEEFGLARLMEAADIVARKRLNRPRNPYAAASDQAQYFHGILRRWRQDGPR